MLNRFFSHSPMQPDATELLAQSDNPSPHRLAPLPPPPPSMSSNLVTIDSPEHFQQVLSNDLERVSVTNFWAPWAEPCKAMNDVVAELAKENSKLLFLNVCDAARARLSLDRCMLSERPIK
jgi:thiol-disulfide isomerase/thioredoxin